MKALPSLRALSIRRKFALLLLLPCLVVLLLAGAMLIGFQLVTFRHNFERDLRAVSEMIANVSTASIAYDLSTDAGEALQSLRVKQHVVAATIITPDRRLFAQYGQGVAEPGMARVVDRETTLFRNYHLLISRPVILDGKQIATLHVLSDFRSIYWSVLKMVVCLFVLLTFVGVAITMTLSHRLQRFVTDPILRLTNTARQIADKSDYSVRALGEEGTELGVLARAFNQMLGHIQQQSEALQTVSTRLAAQVKVLQHEIRERERAEQELKEVHRQLVTASRQAGMAEVATGVLHNVGNVLNSINVSVNIVQERLAKSANRHLVRVSGLLEAHVGDLAQFVTTDPKGKLIPAYLAKLSLAVQDEEHLVLQEMQSLVKSVEHIRDIVSMQQNYASMAGILEDLPIIDLVEDALRLQAESFARHRISVHRHFSSVPPVRVDKHKVLQILVNLFRNAKDAIVPSAAQDRMVTVRVAADAGGPVQVSVQDNGVGIPAENLTRIFQHGFTTKATGHGFGLHSGALAAKGMNGRLHAESAGSGQGATFTLELPIAPCEPVRR